MRTSDYEYEFGRLSDRHLPDGWDRSKRGNLTKKCRFGRVTVFRHPDTSRYSGEYGVMHVRSGPGSEPTFDDSRYQTEQDALYAASDLIEREVLE
jgi:hypothetical protein